jgi:anti-sigma factor RsiW
VIGRSHGSGSAVPSLSHAEAEALISARLDAPLADLQATALAAHLAHCHSCSTFAAQMSAMQSGFRALPHLPASPTVSRQVRERIAQPVSLVDRISGLLGGRVGFAPMAATAALIAILIGGYALLQGDDQTGRQGPTISAGTQIAEDATRTNTAEQTETVLSDASVVPGRILPTAQPTLPTNVRAADETATETSVPTQEPSATDVPTREPTETTAPSATFTAEPSATAKPSSTPTEEPTATSEPTDEPTATHSATPEPTATYSPTYEPTATHTPTE